MRAIHVIIAVAEDGCGVVQLPADVTPGEHEAVLVLTEAAIEIEPVKWRELPPYPVGHAPDTTFRREEIYEGDR